VLALAPIGNLTDWIQLTNLAKASPFSARLVSDNLGVELAYCCQNWWRVFGEVSRQGEEQ